MASSAPDHLRTPGLISNRPCYEGIKFGAIRGDLLITGSASTTESQLRSLLLPLFIAGTILLPSGRTRLLFGLSAVLEVAWLSLAATRTGIVGLVLGPVILFAILPSARRGRLFLLVPAGAAMALFLAGFYSGAWSFILESSKIDLALGFEAARPSSWLDALNAFWRNPWIGDSQGVSHSFFLGTARTMGLVFLVPFVITLWIIWRHGVWLNRQPLDLLTRTLVVGVLAALLISVPLNFLGTMFGGSVSFFFWLLVGMLEAVYLDVRRGHYRIAEQPAKLHQSVETLREGTARSSPVGKGHYDS